MTGNSLHAFGNICQANPHTPGHQQGASREPHSPSSEELRHSGVRREAISPLSKTDSKTGAQCHGDFWNGNRLKNMKQSSFTIKSQKCREQPS